MNAYNIFILVMKIIFLLWGLGIVAQVYNILRATAIHIDTKTESIKLSDKNKMINRLEVRVSSTNAVLSLIDTIISNEVASVLKTYARLKEPYKTINTADDITKISNKVFNSIKKEIFEYNDTVITDEYIMTYINEHTALAFLIEAQKLNEFK
jgi:hypothetical protein